VPSLTGPGLAIAALIALAGAAKVLDPSMTAGALHALRLPSSRVRVRLGAGAEMVLGIAAITVGGPVAWGLVALSYAAFAAFVVAALRQGTAIGSCGCFGREDTPPHWSHVALNAVLASLAAALAALEVGSPLAAVTDHGGAGAAVGLAAAVAVCLLFAVYVELPRTMTATRR
jgi:hypothetical protein